MSRLIRTLTLTLTMLWFPLAAFAAGLTGTVLAPTGEPVVGAEVAATAASVTRLGRTDAAGAFSLELPSATGSITLQVRATGFETFSTSVPDPTSPVEIVLTPRRIFSGTVEVSGTRATAGVDPVTVTNIDSEQIERQYWGQDVPLLLTQAPGMYAYNDNGNGVGYSYFSLRGFDMRRTAVSLNGVPLNDAHSHGVFFVDLADFLATTGDIQVQRGVGSVPYGHSALGGSVDLRTRSPLPEQRLRLATTFGSWGTRRLALEYDSGRTDEGWAATFRWSRLDSDGYRDQSWVESWNYYLNVERIGERSTTRITLFGGPEDTHLAYLGVPRAYLEGEVTGDRDRDRRFNPLTWEGEIDHFFQPHYQVQNLWQLSPELVLDNTFFFFSGEGYFDQYKSDAWLPDYALDPFEGPDGDLVATSDLTRRREVDEWDAGWIPRLEWIHHDGRGRLQVGVATRWHSGRHWGAVTWAESLPPGTEPNHRYYDYGLDKTSFQPFVQETLALNDEWTLLAGLTWTRHRYDMGDDRLGGVEVESTFDYLLPRLGATWQPTPGWSLFANVSRGAREPAFRDLYDPQDPYFGEPRSLDHEELTDFELGARHEFDRGYAAVNLYWLDFDNAIVFGAGLDNNGVPITSNGAVMDHRGVELEAAWTPLPGWGGRLTAAWAHARFDEFVEYDWDGNPVDQSGNAVGFTPELLASLELTGRLGPVNALLTLRHVGEFYLDNTEDLRKDPDAREEPGYVNRVNDAFTVADLAFRTDLGSALAELVQARALTLDLRVNNLLDEEYTTFGYTDYPEPVWIPAATRGFYAGITVDW